MQLVSDMMNVHQLLLQLLEALRVVCVWNIAGTWQKGFEEDGVTEKIV